MRGGSGVSHVNHLPASEGRLEEYKTAQLACRLRLLESGQNGWPDKHSIRPDPGRNVANSLSTKTSFCMTNVLSSHAPTLHKIHEGHTKVSNTSAALSVVARDFEAGRENGGEM
jgi:hypothetical protein